MSFMKNDPVLKQRRKELRQNQTDAEKAFWSKVRNRQLHGLKFFRQFGIGPYIVDFYCPAIKLAIELDGGQHNEHAKRLYDTTRSDYLKGNGICVLRFWNNEVLCDMQNVLSKLEQEITSPCLSRGITPPCPLLS